MERLLFCVKQYKVFNLWARQHPSIPTHMVSLTWAITCPYKMCGGRFQRSCIKSNSPWSKSLVKSLKLPPTYSRHGLCRHKVVGLSLGGHTEWKLSIFTSISLVSCLPSTWTQELSPTVDRWPAFLISLHWMDCQDNHSHCCVCMYNMYEQLW